MATKDANLSRDKRTLMTPGSSSNCGSSKGSVVPTERPSLAAIVEPQFSQDGDDRLKQKDHCTLAGPIFLLLTPRPVFAWHIEHA